MTDDTRIRQRPGGGGTPVRVVHPGPEAADRIQSARGPMVRVVADLRPGLTICQSIADALAPHGLTAAALQFEGLAFAPMRYVMPAYCPDGSRVAFYTRTHAPEGCIEMSTVAASWGDKNGGPFIHMHGIWTENDREVGGHILPNEAIVSRPARVFAYGTPDVALRVVPDAETGFDLFGIDPGTPGGDDGTLLVLRLRPNVDLVEGIEEACHARGITRARILSGIGSTVGLALEGRPEVMKLPTEHVITAGTISPDSVGHPRLTLATDVVDVDGRLHQGTPRRGENPVLICFELFLEVA